MSGFSSSWAVTSRVEAGDWLRAKRPVAFQVSENTAKRVRTVAAIRVVFKHLWGITIVGILIAPRQRPSTDP
jgi:hypothetical protein